MPRRSRGPREPVHSVIGRDATHTQTGKNFNSIDKTQKPLPASLLLLGKEKQDERFTGQRAEQLHQHQDGLTLQSLTGAISKVLYCLKAQDYDCISGV